MNFANPFPQSAETPEGSRLKKNTDNMSKAKYQEGFQQMKGTKTSVADDAAMLQMQQVSFSPPLLIHYLRILNSTFFIRTLKNKIIFVTFLQSQCSIVNAVI